MCRVPHLDLPHDVLHETFDAQTLRRAMPIAASSAILASRVRPRPGGARVTGRVSGTAPVPYTVDVEVHRTGRGWVIDSECSCPVGFECKHAAALLLSVRDRSGPAQPAWEDHLDRVLTGLEELRAPGVDRVPLGLLVEHGQVTTGWSDEPTRTLSLRPVRRGTRDTWVKSDVSWYDVNYHLRYRHDHDPTQVAVLVEMAQAFLRVYPNQNPDLLTVGPLLWPLLHHAREAGIPLVPGTGLTSIEVVDAVTVEVDLAREEADGVRLRAGVQHDGAWWPSEGRELALVGQPAHGAALLRTVPPPGKRRSPHFSLRLAPLDRPVAADTRRLLGAPVVVPAAQRQRFEDTYLPRLRRQLVVGSSDGSVTVPEVEPPRLELLVTWGETHRVETSWSWRYGAERFGIGSTDGLARVREPGAEQAVLAGLALTEPGLRDEAGALRPHRAWTGVDLVSFVEDVLPGLRAAAEAGEIELRETGRQRDYRPATTAPEISFELADAASTDWLDLTVSLTVEDEAVPLSEALAALTRGDDLIFTASGRHVPTSHPAFTQLAELVAAAAELADQPDHGVRVGRADLALWADLEALGIVDAQAEEWLRAARALSDFEELPDVHPGGLVPTLRPYQQSGLNWLAFLWEAGLGGVLADDMGLGKTLQALALITHAREKGAAPFLVVAPTSVVTAWAGQAATHTPGLVVRAVGASAARREATLAELHAGADVVVTTYTLYRLEAEQYAGLEWGGLVLDEAQHVKNHQGKTYHAIRQLPVPFRLALTGTPFENRLMELWSLLSIVAPGLYASPTRFRERVARPVEQQGDDQALARFRRRIRPFLLRRTKERVADDLPPKQELVLDVELGARHRKIYDTHLQRERQTVLGLVDDFDRNRIAIFRALTRLRQLSLDPGLVDPRHDKVGSAKIDLLAEQLAEVVAEGHQALVFSQFTSFLSRVRARLERDGFDVAYLDGRTRKRAEAIERFTSGAASVFLISIKAGGVGLTLTEADYVYVLDPWWNPAVEAQAVDRTHRIGQDKHVMVYRMVATDTIEEKVLALQRRKAELFARVLDGDGAMAADLTAADVRALFD